MDPTLALYEKLKSVQLQGTFPHLASHGITSLHALKKLTLNDYASKAGLNDTEKVEILFNLIQQLKKDTEKSTEINSEEFNNKPGSVGSSINTLASANSTTLVPSVAAPTGLRPPSATVLKNKLISSLAASLLESDLTTSSIVSENTISSNIPLSLSSHAIREPFKSATKAVIKSPIKTNNVKSPSHIRSTSNIKSPSHIRSTSGTSVELKTPPKLATNMTITTNNPNLKSPVTGHKYVAVKSPSGNTAGSSRMHRRSVSATLNAYGIAEKLVSKSAPNTGTNNVSRITVCVRKRPLNEKELSLNDSDVIEAHGNSIHVNENKVRLDMSKYTDQHGFSFDHVFSEHVPNEVIFDKTVKCLIQEILSKRGCKATCFVYGQTGSGKTYTMLHPRNGLYVLAAQEILGAICSGSYKSTCALGNAENNGVSLYVGFYEIYQGQLYDLLQGKTRIFAREDHHQLVQIVGLKEYRVESIEEFQRFVDMGVNERRTGSTGANKESSRSHAILQMSLKSSSSTNTVPPTLSKISFIDLAGSERGADRDISSKHGHSNQVRLEGSEINKSLLALKECIRAMDMEAGHLPFRQSKLTQVLRDSFIGEAKTCMIATIAPNQGNVENTLNTLRYAFRVKEMKHKGSSNPTNEPNTYSPATSMNSTNGALYEGADTTLNGMPKTSGSKVFQDYYQETSPFIGDENGSLYNSSLLEDLECESKDNKPLWSPIKSALTSPIKSIVKSPPVTVKKIKTVATDVATSSPILTSSSSLRKISTVLNLPLTPLPSGTSKKLLLEKTCSHTAVDKMKQSISLILSKLSQHIQNSTDMDELEFFQSSLEQLFL